MDPYEKHELSNKKEIMEIGCSNIELFVNLSCTYKSTLNAN